MAVIDAHPATTLPDPDDAPSPPVHLMSVDEYERASELLGWDRTELVEGVVYDMSAEYMPHGETVMRLLTLLQQSFPNQKVWNTTSVQLADGTEVQPDVYVFSNELATGRGPVPASAVTLAVEVSSTTRRYDLGPKLRAYAGAGVPDYWVVVLQDDPPVLVRHADPEGEAYATVETFDLGAELEHLDDVIRELTAG